MSPVDSAKQNTAETIDAFTCSTTRRCLRTKRRLDPGNELVCQRIGGSRLSRNPRGRSKLPDVAETEGDVDWRGWRTDEGGDTVSRDGRGKLFRQEHYYPGSWGSTISQNRWAASTETAGACERVRRRREAFGFLSVILAKSHGVNAGERFRNRTVL